MVHSDTKDGKELTVPLKLLSAGLAGCTADIFTFPLDTAKVWLQVRGEGENTSSSKSGAIISSKQTPVIQRTVRSANAEPLLTKNKIPASETRFNAPKTTQAGAIKMSNVYKGLPLSLKGEKIPKLKGSAAKHYPRLVQPSLKRLGAQIRTGSNLASVAEIGRSKPGMFKTIFRGVQANGFLSLYGGLAAGLQRQVAFCAVRFGLYDSVKGFYQDLFPGSGEGKQIPQRIMAGTTTAVIAVSFFQPTEVVKIRMQAQTTKPKEERMYKNCRSAYRSIFQAGITEAWKGLSTNALRLGVVNVSELVTYDVVKELILDYKLLNDNPGCHFTSAFIAGFITTLVASPVDVVKTRYMNSQPGEYKGPLECAGKLMVREGFRAFYKGFVPAYLRLGSWNIVMFVSLEQYKIAFKKLL
ncbi:putative mitochondrial transporter UCP3 [Clavelina lepadiformis]|uniref:putative mitochondrial transporter UCP3 n=1 Tax=Clavelina lepadiformis TaxID=159417 RepID=UPI0040426981